MSFYHDIKAHMSPSALDNWLNSRAAFIKSYFQQEKGPTTASMKGGTMIHALVEGGMIKAKHVYTNAEKEIKVTVPGTEFFFMGIPDSNQVEAVEDEISFVDYKSGKANAWAEKLPTDIKMKSTAWLVWRAAGEPAKVKGYIEFIQTMWDEDQKKIVPIDGKETEVISITYTRDEMEAFTKVIAKAMNDVNAFYEKWLKSTGDFVNVSDVEHYAELRKEIAEKEAEMDEIGERILEQMEFGGEENHKTPIGTFYVKTTNSWEYPKDLPVRTETGVVTLEEAEKVGSAVKAAQKNFELVNEPKTTKRSLTYRVPKEK